jgi:hypothetical protein
MLVAPPTLARVITAFGMSAHVLDVAEGRRNLARVARVSMLACLAFDEDQPRPGHDRRRSRSRSASMQRPWVRPSS